MISEHNLYVTFFFLLIVIYFINRTKLSRSSKNSNKEISFNKKAVKSSAKSSNFISSLSTIMCKVMRSHMTLGPRDCCVELKHGVVVVLIKTVCRLYYLLFAPSNSLKLQSV